MGKVKLGRRALSALPEVVKPTVFYDTELKGFGLRLSPPSGRNPKGCRTWIVEYRPGAGGRGVAKSRISLGSTETLSPEKARDIAKTMLANVRMGGDPNSDRARERAAKSVRDLRDLYAAEVDPVRKPRTVQLYRGYWDSHIIPALGNLVARNVSRQDIIKLHRNIGKTHKTTANRVVTLLSHFYGWAAESDYVPTGCNPCEGVKKFGEAGRERYLSEEELGRLGAALERAESEGIIWGREAAGQLSKHAPKQDANRRTKIDSNAADAIRLLLFTGARLREILRLEWDHYDRQRALLLLPDSKTGRKTVVLGRSAVETLDHLWERAIQREPGAPPLNKPLSPFVFPSRDLLAPKADLKRPWSMLTREAGLVGLRIHDLRHSFASVGAAADLGLPVIGKLLGHSTPQTTARYAHLAATPLRNATDRISGAIASALAVRLSNTDSTK
ncbi:tyrosine-type recombinase/integrase [Sphingomonas sp. AP4-R1]|uniref:site-specific integrase n=1 Tax=Sphingomonas sp. AP4-R1 TaxID=2735134 RepID=UPI0014936B38|nr:site-specific integrase [Sphingomonas sp. AP4-R1]QJU56834.1 tyrosine-type recombinase/integrase [Sphingomonas sp. AP4-R1]